MNATKSIPEPREPSEDGRPGNKVDRLKKPGIDEIILATNPTVEGEATATYLTQIIQPLGKRITRLAYGLPSGLALEYADELTLTRAFEGRKEV